MKFNFLILATLILMGTFFYSCNKSKGDYTDNKMMYISKSQMNDVIKSLTDSLDTDSQFRIERGVKQVAELWRETDGNKEDFAKFCKENFVSDTLKLDTLFSAIQRNLEILAGKFNQISLSLKEPLHLTGNPSTPVDILFGGYEPSSHLDEDLFANKVAFVAALNFPYYTLEEKTKLGEAWTRKQWAYARMGDRFTSRVPAEILQNAAETATKAEDYIANYNIYMGNLLNDKGEKLFPKDMVLISHWGLRDELKSDYQDKLRGQEKQEMIYTVMKRIIDQSIPQEVINSGKYDWNPIKNNVLENANQIKGNPENNKRYEVLLSNFKANQKIDAYTPNLPTALARNFEGLMEIPQKDVETLFKSLLSSAEVKQVAAIIKQRLGRDLRPYDIWYNGFKSKPDMPESELDKITQKKYPNNKALEADLPNILIKLGWKPEKAKQIASLIKVDPAKGSGHAWGAQMKNDYAHLRTRIAPTGMNYKGYNIAIHEFGHNVEQTTTMNDVDYWMLNGVPNNAYTEAAAFLFQKRDLELLGFKENGDADKNLALDTFWSAYEIMGVALVDIGVWEWMYAHPDATPAELKEAVMNKAKEIWNAYYADVLGGKDEPLLGIYSHMIEIPLYLSYYPVGQLVSYQLEEDMKGKNIAAEFQRIYTQGRIIPQLWIKKGCGKELSTEPLLKAVDTALKDSK
ncbi:conserved hypothetical protein [uncultured Paludibacter sp.]|nr:conserved hypothetical protein [uncultured Paludibacter sp.]